MFGDGFYAIPIGDGRLPRLKNLGPSEAGREELGSVKAGRQRLGPVQAGREGLGSMQAGREGLGSVQASREGLSSVQAGWEELGMARVYRKVMTAGGADSQCCSSTRAGRIPRLCG